PKNALKTPPMLPRILPVVVVGHGVRACTKSASSTSRPLGNRRRIVGTTATMAMLRAATEEAVAVVTAAAAEAGVAEVTTTKIIAITGMTTAISDLMVPLLPIQSHPVNPSSR
ncbi:hypothetical protein H4R35_002961, partial [Dimargaris xerosporica]